MAKPVMADAKLKAEMKLYAVYLLKCLSPSL